MDTRDDVQITRTSLTATNTPLVEPWNLRNATIISSLPPTLQRLPPELWIIIFLYALPASHGSYRGNLKLIDAPLIPIVLASVCRLWRDIACSTPQLWESCRLNYKHPQLNHIWINRAGSRSLNLHAACTQETYLAWMHENESIGRDAARAFQLSFLLYLKRWKSIRIDLLPLSQRNDTTEWLSLLDAGSSWHAPSLEVFRVEASRGSPMEPSWVAPLVSSASSLRELRLLDADNMSLRQFSHPHLVDLEIEDIWADDALDLLNNLPLLQKFKAGVKTADVGIYLSPSLVHHNLVHFHLQREQRNEEDAQTILRLLSLPSLRILHASNDYEDFPFDELLSLLERSRCRIMELVFTDVRLYEDVFIPILEHESVNPWLKSLTVSCAGLIGQGLLRFLHYKPETPRLPSLERLSITRCRILDCSSRTETENVDGILADILTSRFDKAICYDSTKSRPVNLRHFAIGCIAKPNHLLDVARIKAFSKAVGPARNTCIVRLIPYRTFENQE